MTNSLYLIATPIGNLEDITLRARSLLEKLSVFFVEDTREFNKLLELLGISQEYKKIFSYASHNLKEATEKAIFFLEKGETIAMVCDRGTPAISDPGALLVKAAREKGVSVIPIPGASSVATLVSVSGLLQTRFCFIGFFPSTEKERSLILQDARISQMPTIFFESPQRIRETLKWLSQMDPKGKVFIGREMTKKFEEYVWIELERFDPLSVPEKGEFALLYCGSLWEKTGALEEAIALRVASEKEWAKKLATTIGISSSDIYNELQRVKRGATKSHSINTD